VSFEDEGRERGRFEVPKANIQNFMNPIDIIAEYYDPASKAYKILIRHGKQVAQKALGIAENNAALRPDKRFLENAAIWRKKWSENIGFQPGKINA
jgi:hypothetical protein